MPSRLALALLLTSLTISGCARLADMTGAGLGLSGSQDLGLVQKLPDLPVVLTYSATSNNPDQMRQERNDILSGWVMKSDYLCTDYQAHLSRMIRDSRLGTDIVSTILTGLATIFTQPSVIHPLAGSATIVMGIGGDLQSDLFLQQAGDVIASSIQTIRSAARIEMQSKWNAPYWQYTLSQGLLDVQRYDRETCNLNRALSQIRSAVRIAGPAALAVDNPIVPLLPGLPAVAGAAPPTTTITTTPGTTEVTPSGTITTSPQVAVTVTPTVPPASVAPTPGSPLGTQGPVVLTPPPPPPPVRKPSRGCGVEPAKVHLHKVEVLKYIRELMAANDENKLDSIAGQLRVKIAAADPRQTGFNVIRFVSTQICTADDMRDIAARLQPIANRTFWED